MATKTVILRPISSNWLLSNTGCGLVPSDTTEENAYLLVSESEADDDTTYIHLDGALSCMAFGMGEYNKGNITEVKVYVRAKGTGTKRVFNGEFLFKGTNVDNATTLSIDAQLKGDGWQDYVLNWSNNTDDLELFNSTLYDECQFRISGGTNNDTGSKSSSPVSVDVTQVYLELTYEEPDPIYIRENNTWTPIEGIIYHKENGAWVESNIDIFNNGDKFTLHQLN